MQFKINMMKLIHIQLTVMTFLLMLVSISTMKGQNIETKITNMMENTRNQGFVELDETIVSKGNPQEVLNALSAYDEDPLKQIRHTAMILEYQIAQKHPSDEIVAEVVERLAQHSLDEEHIVWQQAARLLLNFYAADFSDKAADTIKDALNRSELSNEIILVGGIVGHRDEIEKLKVKYQQEEANSNYLWDGKPTWACQLALARMGDNIAINEVVSRVTTENEPILKITRLLKDLEYIRQPQAIEVLNQILNSEERLPSVKTGRPGTKYAYHALDLLAKSIKDFPVKSKGVGCSKQELEDARKWMNEKSTYQIIR